MAKENNVENPIVDSFEKTTENYLNSFEAIIRSFQDGEVIVASHNGDTVQTVQKLQQ